MLSECCRPWTMTTTQLPDKPSELLQMALDDLLAIEKDPNYLIDMFTWHRKNYGRCWLCPAGAVMARRLGAKPDEDLNPANYDDDTERKLLAINLLRRGELEAVFYNLEKSKPPSLPEHVSVSDYYQDHEQFLTDIRGLIVTLANAGE